MGTITIRFNDEEEKTIREMAGEQNLPPSTFLKSIVMENLGTAAKTYCNAALVAFYSTRVLNMTYFSHF